MYKPLKPDPKPQLSLAALNCSLTYHYEELKRIGLEYSINILQQQKLLAARTKQMKQLNNTDSETARQNIQSLLENHG